MAERQSAQDEVWETTKPLFISKKHTYYSTVHDEEWVLGSGAYYDLDARIKKLENIYSFLGKSYAVKYMKLFGRYALEDTIPAASSAEYEWYREVMSTKETVTAMFDTFNELTERLSYYVKLIEHSDELLKLARAMGHRYLREAVLTLHDALCGTYSEDLTIEQIEAIKLIVNQLQDIKWDRQAVRNLDRSLRQQGFETVPSDKFMRSHHERREVDSEATLP